MNCNYNNGNSYNKSRQKNFTDSKNIYKNSYYNRDNYKKIYQE